MFVLVKHRTVIIWRLRQEGDFMRWGSTGGFVVGVFGLVLTFYVLGWGIF